VIVYIPAVNIFVLYSYISTRLITMAASLYIVVEGEDPGFDIFVNGHALARNEDALERLAERLHVAPLLEFFPLTKILWLCCSIRVKRPLIGLCPFRSLNGTTQRTDCLRFVP
jgi:hypothetical protein